MEFLVTNLSAQQNAEQVTVTLQQIDVEQGTPSASLTLYVPLSANKYEVGKIYTLSLSPTAKKSQ